MKNRRGKWADPVMGQRQIEMFSKCAARQRFYRRFSSVAAFTRSSRQ